MAAATVVFAGLSPPTRGSLERQRPRCPDNRPIPAHAGEPSAPSSAWARKTTRRRAYPRPRGGADGACGRNVAGQGLSPPTRGSRRYSGPGRFVRRPIPAHAGEPIRRGRNATDHWAYPRPRGGARPLLSCSRSRPGLSPPTRGSLPAMSSSGYALGPIPAHAGEPVRKRSGGRLAPAYPRPRGGASPSRG